jgi:hypothetical protein
MCVRLLTSALLISGAFAFSSLTAVAQDKKGHDHKDHKHTHPTAQNGGILEDVGEFHVELVAKDGKITLFLRDEDAKDAPTEGFKATVLLTAGSQRVGPVEIKPAGGNKMEGAASAIPAGATAILTLTDKSGTTAQGRFRIK